MTPLQEHVADHVADLIRQGRNSCITTRLSQRIAVATEDQLRRVLRTRTVEAAKVVLTESPL